MLKMWSNQLQIFTLRTYDSVLHIHTVGIEKQKKFYYAIWLKIQAQVLDVPKNGMLAIEHLGVNRPKMLITSLC